MNNNNENLESSYYDDFNKSDKLNSTDKQKGNKKIITIVIILIIISLFLLIRKLTSNEVKGIEFKEKNLQLVVGETKNIELTINAKNPKKIPITWNSDNSEIAVINNGVITAINEGFTVITAKYIGKNGKEFIAECPISVINNKPIITYEISTKEWTNNDITISINAESSTGIDELKYTLNCSENCDYHNIDSNKITINQQGLNKIYILAVTKNNVTSQEIIETKIDKTPPEIQLVNQNETYTGTNEVEVCAICKDNESGCNQEKICQKFTDDKLNETIQFSDKAGNVAKSKNFNVKLTKTKPICQYTEPNINSFNINDTTSLILECTDSIIGIKDTDLTENDFNVSSPNVLQITNIEKTSITNGYKYIITIKGIATGKSKITLKKDVIYSNSGISHDSLNSKDYTINVNCTRRRDCGCESGKWINKGTQTITASCATPPNKTESHKKWSNCTLNNCYSTTGKGPWTCQYSEYICQQYKCC